MQSNPTPLSQDRGSADRCGQAFRSVLSTPALSSFAGEEHQGVSPVSTGLPKLWRMLDLYVCNIATYLQV
jgi:hypothetical protein